MLIGGRSFSRRFEEIFCGNYSTRNIGNGGGGVGILQKTSGIVGLNLVKKIKNLAEFEKEEWSRRSCHCLQIGRWLSF